MTSKGLGCGPLEVPGQKRSRVNIFDVQFRTYGEKKPLQGSIAMKQVGF